jgi:antitoxin YefM
MTVSATEARDRLFPLSKKSIKGHALVEIRSRDGNAVLISKKDYNGLLETLYLKSIPGFMKSLRESKADIKAGRVYSDEEIYREIFGHAYSENRIVTIHRARTHYGE